MNPTAIPPMARDDAARRRSIAFLNWAHAIDHFVLLIYPTVVIGLEVVYKRPYSELIALSSAAFIAFGVFSLPAGWLADHWSRRNMMAAFYIGCGVSLALDGFRAEFADARCRHVRAWHVCCHLSPGRHGHADRGLERARAHARLQRRVRQSRRLARRRYQRCAGHLVRLARRVFDARRALHRDRGCLSLADAGRSPPCEIARIETCGAADAQGHDHAVRSVSRHRDQRRPCFQRADHRAAEDRR